MISREGIELIKSFEGFVPYVYLDAVGYPTIGYGTRVYGDVKMTFILESEAEQLLIKECAKIEKIITPYIRIKLLQNQLDAILSFCYNLGAYNFISSTLRQKLNRGEIHGAADEFLRWVYAGGKKLNGLVRRRQAERAMFLGIK